MSAMPPASPSRRRLFVLLGLLAVAVVVLYYQWTGSAPAAPVVTNARSTVNPVDAVMNQTAAKPRPVAAPGGQSPEPLKLDQMENKVPAEPEAARNLFRFGEPPPPPPPPPRPVVQAPPPDPGPPPPPPIPPIPLKYTVYIKDPNGRSIASLVDKSGTVFLALEGQTVDGRYKLHRITPTSVEMSYLDGTGRRTIPLNGG